MTTEPQVSHPEVSHPEPTAPPAPVPTPAEGETKPAARPRAERTQRRGWRMPPPKVIVAALLVAIALELLLWQVAGVFWGVLVHAILAGLVLAVTAGLLVWRRRAQRRALASGERPLGRAAAGGPAMGQRARGALGRLLGRGSSTGTGAGGKRAGILGGRSSGARRGLRGRLTGAGRSGAGRTGGAAGRSGGLLGRLGKSAAGRRTGAGGGRAAGLLGRLGRGAAARRAGSPAGTAGTRATGGARGRAGAALGRARSGGRALLAAGRARAASRREAAKPQGKKSSFLRGFWQGLRGETKPAREQRTLPPAPKHASGETKQDKAAKPAPQEKPQQPAKERLVKEAVEKAAKVAPQRTGGTSAMGDINKVRAAADELAAALKDYDPETMHQLVREMPQFGEALSAVSAGFRQVASRAESEWPVAAPVAEGLRSIADDIKAGAGTAEETRGTIRRENETDIERGEAPRHGSVESERKWNV